MNPSLPLPSFINRELSLLEFNQRVLAQAEDTRVPVLERLKFLCISCSNLDEFFEIRVAGLKQMAKVGAVTVGPDGNTPADVLAAISASAHELVDAQYRVLNEVMIPALEAENIHFVRRANWTQEQDAWLKTYFENDSTGWRQASPSRCGQKQPGSQPRPLRTPPPGTLSVT